MWSSKTKEEFYTCIADLIEEPAVQAMDDIPQHAGGVSCLDHCIFVSYLSFALCRRWRLDYVAAARAGLLHDLYLCDWKKVRVSPWQRLLVHPQMALENAEQFGLSELERDIILKHMWPLSSGSPKYKESYIVSTADKICATIEALNLHRWKRIGNKLGASI